MEAEGSGVKRVRTQALDQEQSADVIHKWQRLHTEAAFGEMLEVPAASDAIAASSSVLPDPTHDLECTHEHLRGDRRVGEAGSLIQQIAQEKRFQKEHADKKAQKEKKQLREKMYQQLRSSMASSSTTESFILIPEDKPGRKHQSKKSHKESHRAAPLSDEEESEPMLLRDHSNASHLSQAGPQLDASVLSLQPRAWLPVPILHVDWAGQVHRVSGEDIIRGDEPSQKAAHEIPVSLRSSNSTSSLSSISVASLRAPRAIVRRVPNRHLFRRSTGIE